MGSIIFGLFSMVFMLVIFLAVVFFAIFMARKIGLLKAPEEGVEGAGTVADSGTTDKVHTR